MGEPTGGLLRKEGGKFIRNALATNTDPSKVIDDFQRDNGIASPAAVALLPFLDLNDLTRAHVYDRILTGMKQRLDARLDELDEAALIALIDGAFAGVEEPILRPIVMKAMARLQNVPERFLNKLVQTPAIYEACPVEVKRQLWQYDSSVFVEVVQGLIKDYVSQCDTAINAVAAKQAYASVAKARHDGSIVVKLVGLLGDSVDLYNVVLQAVRRGYLDTHNLHYCTLRTELIMVLHEQGVSEIYTLDPCYHFAWSLDACIKDRLVSNRIVTQLEDFFADPKLDTKGAEMGDLAMIVEDPLAMRMLMGSVYAEMHDAVDHMQLPSEKGTLLYCASLGRLALSAWDFLRKQKFSVKAVEKSFVHVFMPLLMGQMVKDRAVKLPPLPPNLAPPAPPPPKKGRRRQKEGAPPVYEDDTWELPGAFFAHLKASELARKVAMQHMASMVANAEWATFVSFAEHYVLQKVPLRTEHFDIVHIVDLLIAKDAKARANQAVLALSTILVDHAENDEDAFLARQAMRLLLWAPPVEPSAHRGLAGRLARAVKGYEDKGTHALHVPGMKAAVARVQARLAAP